jgi:hypothetical protein
VLGVQVDVVGNEASEVLIFEEVADEELTCAVHETELVPIPRMSVLLRRRIQISHPKYINERGKIVFRRGSKLDIIK